MKHLKIFEEYGDPVRDFVEEYKGSEIYDREGVIVVAQPGEHWSHDFIIDLDDSKSSGGRTSAGMNYEEQLDAAKEYIDWRITTRNKQR